MLHIAAGVLDLQHRFHPETYESENDQDVPDSDTRSSSNQGRPLISNSVDNLTMESFEKPPGVETERKEITLKEELSSPSCDIDESHGKLLSEGKVQKLMTAMVSSDLSKMERSRGEEKANFAPSLHPQGYCPVEKDSRSCSPESHRSFNSTPPVEGSPTNVKDEPSFEVQLPERNRGSSHDPHQNTLMTDSGIYDHDLGDSDSSDSSESKKNRIVEVRVKVESDFEGTQLHGEPEGREGRHASAGNDGALGDVSESEFGKDADDSSLTQLKDDLKSSHERQNPVDLSWYDVNPSDFFIHSSMEGNASDIVEFQPKNQRHGIHSPKTKSRESENRKKMVMFIEMPKRRHNTDSSFDTDEDEIAAYIYDPQINDSYNACLMKSRDFLEDPYVELHRKIKEEMVREGNILDDPFEDPNFAMPSPSSPVFIPSEYDEGEEDEFFMQDLPPFGGVTSKRNGSISYKFEMHDTTWGVSSGEVYFDRITGQRILSTIYEFEVSSDEDTESYYRMTESRATSHQEDDTRSFRKDSLEENSYLFSFGAESEDDRSSIPDVRLCKEESESEKGAPSIDLEKSGNKQSDLNNIEMSESTCDSSSSKFEPVIVKNETSRKDNSDIIEPSGSHDVAADEKSLVSLEKENESDISKEDDGDKDDPDGKESALVSTPKDIEAIGESTVSSDEFTTTSAHSCDTIEEEQETLDIPIVVVSAEEEPDISIVVTPTDDNYDSSEEFFTSDTYISSRDNYLCSENEPCNSDPSCLCMINLDVMSVSSYSHLSDDESFLSDAETDVTYVSHLEHHDVGNFLENDFSDPDDNGGGGGGDGHDNSTNGNPSSAVNPLDLANCHGRENVTGGHDGGMSHRTDGSTSANESTNELSDSPGRVGDDKNMSRKNSGDVIYSNVAVNNATHSGVLADLEVADDLEGQKNTELNSFMKDNSVDEVGDHERLESHITDCSNIESASESKTVALVTSSKMPEFAIASNIDANNESFEVTSYVTESIDKNQLDNANTDVKIMAHFENETPKCESKTHLCENKISQSENENSPDETEISRFENNLLSDKEKPHLDSKLPVSEYQISMSEKETSHNENEIFNSESETKRTEVLSEIDNREGELHVPDSENDGCNDVTSTPIVLDGINRISPNCDETGTGNLVASEDECLCKEKTELAMSLFTTEKQPITSVIQDSEEKVDELSLPSVGVIKVVCVCCENLIVQKSIVEDSNEENANHICSGSDINIKESVKERTAPLIDEECRRMDIHIGSRINHFQNLINEKVNGFQEIDSCLTGEEFEICVPDSDPPPVKPQRLYLRKFVSDPETPENTYLLPTFESSKDHIHDLEIGQPPIKPKRRKKSPQSFLSPPRKMQKVPETQVMTPDPSKALYLNDEKLLETEKQIGETTIVENCDNDDDVDDDCDGVGGRKIADDSRSSSLSEGADGKIRGKRVGMKPDPRDLNNRQSVLNNNPFAPQNDLFSHEEHQTLPDVPLTDVIGSENKISEISTDEKDANCVFNKPINISEIVSTFIMKSRQSSSIQSHKLNSGENEDTSIISDRRESMTNIDDVFGDRACPSGEEISELCIHDKSVEGGEVGSHSRSDVNHSVLQDHVANAFAPGANWDPLHEEDVTQDNILQTPEVSFPCPPKRKKKSPPSLSDQDHRRVLLDKANLPVEDINESRTPPKVPPRTYRRCHSLPRRPRSRPSGSLNPDTSLGARKAVGRSASTATCRPHSSNDLNSRDTHKIHRTPVQVYERPISVPTSHNIGLKHSVLKPSKLYSSEGLFVKKIGVSLSKKGSFTNKHFSLPRTISKKITHRDIDDSATSSCFPNLFHRKHRVYDFSSSSPRKTSEIPQPEPFVRKPSTGSVDSFSDLFGFSSSIEYDQTNENIDHAFEERIDNRIVEGVQIDEKPPQIPPRRHKKVSKTENSFVEKEINETSIMSERSNCERDVSQDIEESSVKLQDAEYRTIPDCLENSDEKVNEKQMGSPLLTNETANEVLQNNNFPIECAPSPITKSIENEMLDDSGIEISQDDFNTKPLLSTFSAQTDKRDENDEACHEEKAFESNSEPRAQQPLSGDDLHQMESFETEITPREESGNLSTAAVVSPITDALSLETSGQIKTWTPPEVSLRTWAQRQGVEEVHFTPLSLRCQSLERKCQGYGSLKLKDKKTHQSLRELSLTRHSSLREKSCTIYKSLEDISYSKLNFEKTNDEDTPSPGPPVETEKEEGNNKSQKREEDTKVQQDRCIEVYPETVRQRQRNTMTSSNKVDIKNWSSLGMNNNDTLTSPSKVKKFLPSVKALRNQFETGKTNNNRAESNGNGVNSGTLSRKSSNSSLASSSLEKTSSTNSLNSNNSSVDNVLSSNNENRAPVDPDEPVEPIFSQFKQVDEELRELMSKPPSTTGWNPRSLLKRLYYVPEAPKHHSQGTTYINIEGYLEKLPSGRKKATFWNAWKRRYFVAKDGVLYYYQNPQTDKPSMKMTLMGGKVECMEPSMVGVDDGSRDSIKAGAMIGIDDGKGHYVVVRCSSKQEAERWRCALETHTVEDFASQYVQPWPIPTNPTLLRDTLVIDLGSSSVRAGVLASQATLPQVFVPSVVATERESRRQIWGFDALSPDVRSVSSISFPVRPSHKISKYSVDLSAVSSLLQKAFADLRVDPKNYNVQLSVPRILNPNTQTELLRLLFDKYGVKSVNLTHQSILALYAYNATSGIVVDIGERMDIVPVIDGYIVDGGVSRVPYGGYRILDHLRQFLYMRNISLINEVESYILRHVLENICYCAHHYNTEKARCTNNPDNYEKGVSLAEYFPKDGPYEYISLDFGRFQATEGLFNPDAWGLDHPGLHKLVHKAIMECSMDIRKEMSRSIFLAGGVTQLPGLVDRLTTEIDNLTPPAIRPKVHASPYRYHAAYIGACVLAESPAFNQSKITHEDWNKHGSAALRKWSL